MRAATFLLIAGLSAAVAAPAASADWITAAAAPPQAVLHFRRDLVLDTRPQHLWVEVSADNRFVLYVNGHRAGSGPSTSDLAHWRHERIDIGPWLKPGVNHVAAEVWNFVVPGEDDLSRQTGPLVQQTAGSGFWLSSDIAGLDSGPLWRAHVEAGHKAESGYAQINAGNWYGYYVAGAPERVDAALADWDWRDGKMPDWSQAVVTAGRATVADPLPAQTFAPTSAGKVVRGGDLPMTVAANSHVSLLVQRDVMVSAYPQLRVTGGKGAVIGVTYTEAPYTDGNHRGLRDNPAGTIKGLTDTFIADGGARTFAPLWWRTWRFVQIDVQTAAEPLKLEGFSAFETGYPFQTVGSFESDDPDLNAIWDIGWRTARIDAHETYMDSAYWEQLQYVGDTRLQMLISYAVSGDDRLAVNAIDAFGWSNTEGGLTEGAYPSRGHNPIAPFSLLWIGMMHDYWMQQPDTDVIQRNLPRAREVIDWFKPHVHEDGLLGRNPTWNFVDWVGKDRDAFPSFDSNNESCLTTLIYLGALRQMADLDPQTADADRGLADRLAKGVQAKCWDASRGLYADDPSKTLFSQHANALAILYDVSAKAEAPKIFGRVLSRHGLEPPEGIIPASYYFSWYLVRAKEHAGRAEDYFALLHTWRELLQMHFSTWPEAKLEARSDTHAWSGHPTADLLALVAGIEPSAPGYASVRIAPHLGALKKLKATAMTPSGPIHVDYRIDGAKLHARIERPRDIPGVFVWRGVSYPLTASVTQLALDD